METTHQAPRPGRGRLVATSLAALSMAAATTGVLGALAGSAEAAATAVPLGSAGSFAVLAGSGLTNTGVTTLSGDAGSYPTPSETGFGACPAGNCVTFASGTNEFGNGVTQQAKTDLTSAYNAAAGEGPSSPVTADLGGQTLNPGVYNSASSLSLSGTVPLTLNGGGDPNSVFVFQAGSTLITGSASQVSLINGAQSCHVFWQVGSSTTLGSGSTFRGTILDFASISLADGVTVDGRLLAGEQASGTGAVTLIHDTITAPTCAAVVPPPVYVAPPTTAAPTTTTSTTAAPTTTTSTTAAPTTTTSTTSTTEAPTSTTSTTPAPIATGPVTTTKAPVNAAPTTLPARATATGVGPVGAGTTPAPGTSPAPGGTALVATSSLVPASASPGTPTSLRVVAGGGAGASRAWRTALRWGLAAGLSTLVMTLMTSAWRRRGPARP
jgi:hypothetical protein